LVLNRVWQQRFRNQSRKSSAIQAPKDGLLRAVSHAVFSLRVPRIERIAQPVPQQIER